MAEFLEIDFSQIKDFGIAFEQAPKKLLKNTATAFKKIGFNDIERFRKTQLSGGTGLNLRSKGLAKAFKYNVPKKVTDFSQLRLSEYTGWKAAEIFQTGGTIRPKGGKKLLTVLTDNARTGTGKRKWTQKQFRQMLRSGELRMIYTKKIIMVVRNVGGRVKKGKKRGQFKNDSRNEIVAYMVPSIKLRKRIDFYENFRRGGSDHKTQLDWAAQKTVEEIAEAKNGGGNK